MSSGRKLFVGSLPDNIPEASLKAVFQQYGPVEDCFVKPHCEPGRQIAFVTFATAEHAQFAKDSCDRLLLFPGCDRPCEVMVARNQGTFGQPPEIASFAPVGPVPRAGSPPPSLGGLQSADGGPRKIHVGSLPDGITDWQLRDEFSKFGEVVEVYVKQHCEPGRQWAFVTFQNAEEAKLAKDSCDRVLVFPGSLRACEVIMARNQGPHGQQPLEVAAAAAARGPVAAAATITAARIAAPPPDADGPKKILVGSLPDFISEEAVRAVFAPYGAITDVYVKPGCEPGRQWAFVSYVTHHQAYNAKVSTDRILVLPGSARACEVMFARADGAGQAAVPMTVPAYVPQPAPTTGGATAAPVPQCKIFVGSLPGHVSESQLREEFERFGRIVDAFVKPDCELGRQWGFVTYTNPEDAVAAKEATDRILFFPGSDRACEVMIAKRKEPVAVNGMAAVVAAPPPVAAYAYSPGQPPPPNTPAPFDLHATPWRLYYTKDGLPYYHNHVTGQTQWDRPRDLPPLYAPAPVMGHVHRRPPY